MTDNKDKKEKNGWFFLNNYSPEEPKTQQEEINSLSERLNKLETDILPRIDRLDQKLDRLIDANKSLIAYFSEISPRELNHQIRSYPSGKTEPVNFKPERKTRFLDKV